MLAQVPEEYKREVFDKNGKVCRNCSARCWRWVIQCARENREFVCEEVNVDSDVELEDDALPEKLKDVLEQGRRLRKSQLPIRKTRHVFSKLWPRQIIRRIMKLTPRDNSSHRCLSLKNVSPSCYALRKCRRARSCGLGLHKDISLSPGIAKSVCATCTEKRPERPAGLPGSTVPILDILFVCSRFTFADF